MDTMNLLPVGGSDGVGIGGAALGAFGGALIGSWFGDGFGGRGRGGFDGGAVGVVQAVDNTAVLSAINTASVMNLQGQNGINLTTERAASSTFTGLTSQNTQNLLASVQGFAGLNTQILQGTNATVAAIGAADVNALTRSFQAQLAAQECCCETNLNIERQGNETRGLIRDQFATAQAVEICDLKSREQALRFENSQLHQTAQLTRQIAEVYQLVNFKLPTPPTPPVI